MLKKSGSLHGSVINGGYGVGVIFNITPGMYTDYTIPLSSIGNPTINEIGIGDFGENAPCLFYIDDIGFI